MSSKNNAGDFRRISRETWQKFREFYPGSGPSITMEYVAAMGNGEEPYIGKHFVILDPPPAPKVTISKSKKKKALAAAAAAEAAAAAKAADAAKAAQPGGAVHIGGGYGSEDEAERTRSRSESSASFSVGTQNRPKVVANLPPPPGQPRNPVAEQYTRQAIAQANEETSRTSERSMSVASQQSTSQHGAPPRYGSFSGGVPQQPPPTLVPGPAAPQRYNSFSGSVPPAAAGAAPAAHEAAQAAPVAAPKRVVSVWRLARCSCIAISHSRRAVSSFPAYFRTCRTCTTPRTRRERRTAPGQEITSLPTLTAITAIYSHIYKTKILLQSTCRCLFLVNWAAIAVVCIRHACSDAAERGTDKLRNKLPKWTAIFPLKSSRATARRKQKPNTKEWTSVQSL
jgi:hypothetical protein